YFALDENDMSFMGMNRIVCSSITIRFLDGKVNNLSFYVSPEARFIPPHELKKEEMRLRGFQGKGERRPDRSQVARGPILPAARPESYSSLRSSPVRPCSRARPARDVHRIRRGDMRRACWWLDRSCRLGSGLPQC